MAHVRAAHDSGTSLLLPLLARTATVLTTVTSPRGARGAIILINSTEITATPIVTVTIELLDGDGAYTEVYWTAAATITTAADTSYIFYPGVTAADVDVTEEISAPIPREWQLTLTHTDADSITYSVFVQWLF